MATVAISSGCDACRAAAANPLSGRFDSGCRACQVRFTAGEPAERRRIVYAAIADPGERQRFIDDVSEFHRSRHPIEERV